MSTLKKTLALVSALALATTAFAACGKDDESSSTPTTSKTDTPKATEPGATAEVTKGGDNQPSTGMSDDGKIFTVYSWNANDFPHLLAAWNADWDAFKTENIGNITERIPTYKTPSGKVVKFINAGVQGGKFSTYLDALFTAGDDVDVYPGEADWAMYFTNDNTKSAPLADLGIKREDFADAFDYTFDIGENEAKVLKGATWQACPGGFAYRKDLAADYLGATSPAEMQDKVKDWDTFWASAATVKEKSGGSCALAATVGGVWQVFSSARTSAWVDVSGKLSIDDSCKTFINDIKAASENGYVTKVSQWAEDGSWHQLGQNGKAMGFFVSTWGFGDAILLKAAGGATGETFGKWNLCVGPQAYFWGGTWILVPPNTDNKSDAADFIKKVCGDPTTMKNYAIYKGEYVNNKAVMADVIATDKTHTEGDSFKNLGGQDYFEVLNDAASKITFRDADGELTITKDDATIKQDFIDSVNAYISGANASADATIADFKTRVKGHIASITVD